MYNLLSKCIVIQNYNYTGLITDYENCVYWRYTE